MRGYFDNSSRLVRFILKRERVISVVWIIILVLFSVAVPPALNKIFVSESDSQAMVETMKNPAMIAMMGPVYGAHNYSIGAMYTNMMLLFTILAVAIMNIFLVVRHTRGDEEKGRGEVIRSLPVGRLSNLNATMIVAAAVNVIIAVLCGLVMAVLGIETMDFAGSMLFGVALGVSGMFFAAVTALFVQLSSSSRGAIGYSFVVLGICYMVRAVGDVSSEVLSLISPLGLILRTQAYVENHWWPVFIVLLLTLIMAAIAYYLNSIRDIDQGFIPAKPGKKEASVMLQSSFGLALRLLRNTMIAWAIGMFIFGAAYGSIMGDIETFIAKNEFYQQLIPSSPDYSTAELFTTMLNSILSMCCVIPIFTAVLKLRGEEKENRSEHVLARVVSRKKYLAGYVSISIALSFIMLFAAVFGLWSTSASVMDNPISFFSMLRSMMVYLPALWVMIGVAVLLVGALPKASSFVWAYLGFTFIAVYLGRIINIPEWVKMLTPFGYIPELPIDSINYVTLTILTVISIILIFVGFFFYRKRDMQT